MEPETLHTPHLVLTPLRVADAATMATVLADPGLHRFTGGRPATMAELAERYARQVAGVPRGWLNWILRSDGHPIGYAQATVTGGTAELAWVIGTRWQGRGHATAAATAVAEWLRGNGISTFIAHVHPANVASAAVARHLGLRPTDTVLDGEVRWVSTSGAGSASAGRCG